MNNNSVFVAYYIYAAFIIGLFSYIVFGLDYSGAWYILALILLDCAPKTKKEEK